MEAFELGGSLPPIVRGPKQYVPYQAGISCNSPEFNELDDQMQNM